MEQVVRRDGAVNVVLTAQVVDVFAVLHANHAVLYLDFRVAIEPASKRDGQLPRRGAVEANCSTARLTSCV